MRRANVSRKGGPWQHEDYDVRDVGRPVSASQRRLAEY
jgi:hypothetical protein